MKQTVNDQHDAARAPWQAPTLRRIDASEAEVSTRSRGSDGQYTTS